MIKLVANDFLSINGIAQNQKYFTGLQTIVSISFDFSNTTGNKSCVAGLFCSELFVCVVGKQFADQL